MRDTLQLAESILAGSKGAYIGNEGVNLRIRKSFTKCDHDFPAVFVGHAVNDGVADILVRHCGLDGRGSVVADAEFLSHDRFGFTVVAMALLTVLHPHFTAVSACEKRCGGENGGKGKNVTELCFHSLMMSLFHLIVNTLRKVEERFAAGSISITEPISNRYHETP